MIYGYAMALSLRPLIGFAALLVAPPIAWGQEAAPTPAAMPAAVTSAQTLEPLSFWRKMKLGAAYYTNPQVVEQINYASTKAQAAFEYLVQTLNGNVALPDRRDIKTGSFSAIDGDLCHIHSRLNFRITGAGTGYAVALDTTQEFYARDLDIESLSIVDLYKQGVGSYSTRGMKFKTIRNNVSHNNILFCQLLSCDNSKFKLTDTADSIIFNGNENTILRAAMTLARECGAKVRDF
jgi:hypothetical protein